MFNSRTSSQKPGHEFLANFRQQFPELGTATSAPPPQPATTARDDSPAVKQESSSGSRSQESAGGGGGASGDGDGGSGSGGGDAFGDQDPTPRASNEPWRFTPSLLDPGSFSFSSFVNAPSGYYTPTPGGTNTIYHPQAGDLHTPTLGLMGLNTPLSLPTSEAGSSGEVHSGGGAAAMVDLQGFQALQPHQFHHFNPFTQVAPPPPRPLPPRPPQARPSSFAPSAFLQHDTGYETMEHDGSPLDSDPSPERMLSIDDTFQPSTRAGFHMGCSLVGSGEKFRFHSTLNAPTAMVRHADEIPITYLNKGQAYALSIIDTAAAAPLLPGTRYRTYVRVSFEDEQRTRPGLCWTLWKEGRGTSEAHQRGGRLQAVEYVEPGGGMGIGGGALECGPDDDRKARAELESASFDGFSVIWTPGTGPAAPEVAIAVRFNFLSTDFSHSKGVKGIPVRLCAKTTPYPAVVEPVGAAAAAVAGGACADAAEISYCKVKLFRDHGAERKLSNDVAHVKKTIDKLKQQIAQAESGMKDFGKRKRTGAAQSRDVQRPGKVPKHKRTWSISSASSADASGGNSSARLPAEEDLHMKLQALQDMFTSTRPVSVLYLRGDELDDPDLHPVSLSVSALEAAAAAAAAARSPNASLKLDTATSSVRDGPAWQIRSGRNSIAETASIVSPSPSQLSLTSQTSAHPGGSGSAGGWQGFDSISDSTRKALEQQQQHQQQQSQPAPVPPPQLAPLAPPLQQQQQQHPYHQPIKIGRAGDAGNLSGWIEALGVDPSYRPPQPISKPVACFYIIRRDRNPSASGSTFSSPFPHHISSASSPSSPPGQAPPRRREYHRAVYLAQRTARELADRIAAKWGLDPSKIARCVHVLARGGLEVEIDDDVVRELQEGQDMVLELEEVSIDPEGGGDGYRPSPPTKPSPPQQRTKREWEMSIDPREEESPGAGATTSTEGAIAVETGLVLRLTF